MYENEENKEFVPKAPDYKGEGIAIWKATDKNGKLYLKVKILGNIALNAFKYEPKPKVQEDIL